MELAMATRVFSSSRALSVSILRQKAFMEATSA